MTVQLLRLCVFLSLGLATLAAEPSSGQARAGDAPVPSPVKLTHDYPSWTGPGIRTAGSLVYVWTRLWQETGDPLWKAKADAMVQSILVTQDPVDGGLSYAFHRSTGDTTNHQPYDAVETAFRLVDFTALSSKAK